MRQPFFYVKTKENVMGSDKETGSNNQIPHEELRELEGVTFEVEEPELHGDKKVRRKGVYLLPNLFTTAALFKEIPSCPLIFKTLLRISSL